ncbi:ComF family protein [Nocardia panacis]|uniref:ComF family protein n=1 Tax=Nocardia panacis TaxID=2340916 RepID=A0A3A4K487_9NOCA|nr:ComF family protein [Nocardia panacis]RJO79954.1 ComF family protein [Nocardia panacis]
MRTLLDLVLPASCGGCDTPGVDWCTDCAAELSRDPIRLRPRSDPGVPCWALGPYRGAARRAVLAAKERGRRDLAAPLGVALARALSTLRAKDRPLMVVPAPSRRAAARRRGGDPVLRAARAATGWLHDCQVVPLARTRWYVRDSVGLTTRERHHNLHGRIIVAPAAVNSAQIPENVEVVLVDDVLTTGATATETVRALSRVGLRTRAVLVVCGA